MNKKGFTLMELLATIVIIAIVSAIATVSISGMRAKIQANMFDSKLSLAIGSAKNWGQDNKEVFTNDDICGTTKPCIIKTIDFLISSEYLSADDNIGNIFDNVGMRVNDTQIKMYIYNGRVQACVFASPVDATDEARSVYDKYSC